MNANAHTFDDGKEDGAHDGAIPRSLVASSRGKGSSGEESGNDGVVWILLLANAFDGAIKSAEHAAPDSEIASCDWRAGLDRSDHAYPPFAIGGVSVALDAVP